MPTPMDEARDLIGLGRFDAALKLLRPLPETLPGRDRLLAEAFLGKRKREPAFAALSRALAENPADEDVIFLLGRYHLLINRPDLAVAAFRRLPECYPARAEALAGALRRDARYAEVLAVEGDGEQVLFEKANALAHLGRAAEALAAFDELSARNPDLAAAWFGGHAPAIEIEGMDPALERLSRAASCSGANGKYQAFLAAYALLRGGEPGAVPAKHAYLVDAIRALLPFSGRVFGVSATLLRHALETAQVPGLVLEFGVRRGNSITQLAAWAEHVHGFDSFEGLPDPWVGEGAGVLTTGAELPIVPANVTLHPGWFSDTLPPFFTAHPGPVRFANIDSDIYSSAVTVLEHLAPRLQPGSVLVFDEFVGNRSWDQDEYRAFQEFVVRHRVRYNIFAVAPFTKQVAIRIEALEKA